MLERQKSGFAIECDSCGETDETCENEFGDAWLAFKNAGWRAEKIGDEWTHKCPRCASAKKTGREMFGD